jgi:hypothetical protein
MFYRVLNFRHIAAIVFAAILTPLASAQTPTTGVHARATAADYAVSQQTNHATYAASLIPADQVKHLFPIDISKTYLVFEVACYPSQSGPVALNPVAVNPRDFLIKSASHSEFVHPTDALTIAAFNQDKRTPPSLPGRGPQVTTEVGVGYESGRDPYTGQRVHGTYTEAGVGVTNNPGPDMYPPPRPRPGSSPQDRQALENELSDKSLPRGTFTAPVAGFLYFAAEPLKKSKGTYDLQHLDGAASKIDLIVPAKQK